MDLLIQSVGSALQSGQHYTAGKDGGVAYITREDCARAAAAALYADFDGKQTLAITGTKAYTQSEIMAVASNVFGKDLAVVPITVEQATQGMVGAGLPEPVAQTYASIDVAIAEGKLDTVSTAVADLTGEAPTELESFLKANSAAILG